MHKYKCKMHIHNYEMSQQRHMQYKYICMIISFSLQLHSTVLRSTSQYILDSQKLYMYRAVVALSIVFYNVSNSSLLYGPAAVRLALAFFNCSVLATQQQPTPRARRQYAGGRRTWRGGSITKSARPKEQLALLSCCRVLLLASKEALSIVYIPCQAEHFDTCARAIAHELKRVRASRERWPVFRPPGPLEHRARALWRQQQQQQGQCATELVQCTLQQSVAPKAGKGDSDPVSTLRSMSVLHKLQLCIL